MYTLYKSQVEKISIQRSKLGDESDSTLEIRHQSKAKQSKQDIKAKQSKQQAYFNAKFFALRTYTDVNEAYPAFPWNYVYLVGTSKSASSFQA